MDKERLIKKLRALLGKDRFGHSLRVRDTVIELADIYGINKKKAELAALLHDVSRYLDRPGMLRTAKIMHIKTDDISRSEPKLLHAEISAKIAKRDFKIKDKSILNAIKNHTLGSTKMTPLDKAVYIADHTERGRTHAGVELARRLAKKDMDKAIVAISSSMIEYLLGRGLPVHPKTVEVRNYYLKNYDKKK
jgi:predicted HD superfamily hydrolase involved in NAD metabolism